MNGILLGFKTDKSTLLIISVSSFIFFVWYYAFSYYLLSYLIGDEAEKFYFYNASFNFILSSAIVVCSFFIHRLPNIRLWSCSSVLGVLLIMLIHSNALRLAIYFSLGVTFGMGLLNFFTLYGESTISEERGRSAALIEFLYLSCSSVILAFIRNQSFNALIFTCFFLSLIILFFDFLFLSRRIKELDTDESIKLNKRTIIFYLVPWVSFSLINATTARVISFQAMKYIIPLFSYLMIIMGAIGAIIGGVISDFIGRKIPLAFALTLYGISSVFSAFVKVHILVNFMFIITGLTWGILSTLYLYVVWGDLADKNTYQYTYSIGLGTFFATSGLGSLITPEILKIPLFTASITNCLIIFISNIFIILAPEILPSDVREKTCFKLYIYLVKRRKRLLNHG